MTDTLNSVLTSVAAIGAGATGGVYLAFSTMVMPSLRKRAAAEAISTMRTINEMAVRAPFMTLFFGGAASAAAVIATEIIGREPAAIDPVRVVGAALALAGFAVTITVNVPRNNALAHATSPKSATVWQEFDRRWSRANHLRGALALFGAIALTASLAT